MRLELTATVVGAEMVLRMRDGVEHFRWSIAEEDNLEAALRLEAGRKLLPRPWSLDALDAALQREDYRRVSNWWPGRWWAGLPRNPLTMPTLRVN